MKPIRSFLNWRPGADEAAPQFFEPKAGSGRSQTADETDNS